MVKAQSDKKLSGKGKGNLNSGGLKGGVRKQKNRRKKSIHANTFEERQENRRKKEQIKQKKQLSKTRRDASRALSAKVIDQVTTWAQDNPLHPSTIPKPTQLAIRSIGPFEREQKTYKVLLKCLPNDLTPQEIDDHFYRRKNVQIDSIKLMVHRKTERVLGMGFLEFRDKLEYEKSLTQNFTLLKGKRILVEQNLKSFLPSKKRPQKLITYNPPKKLGPWKNPESKLEKESYEDEIQIIEELRTGPQKELQMSEDKNKVDENKEVVVEMEMEPCEKPEKENQNIGELQPEEGEKEVQASKDKNKLDENKPVDEMETE